MPSLIVDTAVVVSVGPLIDDTDFKATEEAIAYNAAGMSIDLFKSTGAAVTKVDLTLTTGGANDWTHKGNAVYELEISAAQNDTEGELWVVGKCTGVLVFESPHYSVVTANVYNSLVAGTDNLDVEVAAAQMGTLRNLGDGATLSGMLSSLAGKTSNAGSYDRTSDSQEAIRDNSGSGGLTAQQTRDAMKLTPSAGAAETDSIDARLDVAVSSRYAGGNITGNLTGSVGSVVADVNANLVKVEGSAVADTGVGLLAWFKRMLSINDGDADVSTVGATQVVAVKNRDGATETTHTITTATGARVRS